MGMKEVDGEIQRRMTINQPIQNIIMEHEEHGKRHIELILLHEGTDLLADTFKLENNQLLEQIKLVYDLTMDIQNTWNETVYDLDELVSRIILTPKWSYPTGRVNLDLFTSSWYKRAINVNDTTTVAKTVMHR